MPKGKGHKKKGALRKGPRTPGLRQKDQILRHLSQFALKNYSAKDIRNAVRGPNQVPPHYEIESDSGLEPEVPEEDTGASDSEELNLSGVKYDPATIRVAFRQYPIDLLLKRISEGAINFNPGFQRAANIWNLKAKSRLIESLLIKIPIPVFYLDSSNEDSWGVIDGVQRLTTFKEFAVDKSLKLKGLEFMPELSGNGYDALPRSLQRRFLESQISLYLIEKGTPDRVKQSIYERINTGGTTLVQQEIRHAIFQGVATRLLDGMAGLESFKRATDNGISGLRMADKECVLRFIAFFLTDYRSYQVRDMDKFLSDTMEKLSKTSEDERHRIQDSFESAMIRAFTLFGSAAFRKPYQKSKINKALFETLSSTLAKMSEEESRVLITRKKVLRSRFIKLMKDEDFVASISSGTGDVQKVHKRFEEIERLIRGVLP